MSAAASRPRRSSAKATADKINASLKAEGAKIDEPPQTEPPPPRSAGSQAGLHNAKKRVVVPKAEATHTATTGATSGKAGKRPVTISLLDDDAGDHGVGKAASASKRPAGGNNLAAPKAKRAAPSMAAGGGGGGARGAGADSAAHAEGDVLLGHFVSRCVGIQHYRNNGVRYNKEPLHLRRDPNNPYDKNAISVRTLAGWLGLGLGLGLGIGLGLALALTRAAWPPPASRIPVTRRRCAC